MRPGSGVGPVNRVPGTSTPECAGLGTIVPRNRIPVKCVYAAYSVSSPHTVTGKLRRNVPDDVVWPDETGCAPAARVAAKSPRIEWSIPAGRLRNHTPLL